MREHALHHDRTLNNPVTCLCEPRFLVAWNIHVSCNLSCAMRGIVSTRIGIVAMRAKAMHETRVGTNMQLTFVIHEQLTNKNMLNSVHNCESHTRINSLINYQGNGLIVHT